MLTQIKQRELVTLNHLNQIAAVHPHVDVVPCGGSTKRSADMRDGTRKPVAFHGNGFKVVNHKAPHGSQIKSRIFDSQLPGIEWALKAGFPVNNLDVILEGMR